MARTCGPTMSLWPRLRRNVKERRKKKRKENPYASRGLDTFAQLVVELQAKRLVMVDKTTMSVSAVRNLSKSAQEWTAFTLSRTASKLKPELCQAPDTRNCEPKTVNAGGAKEEGIPQQECATELSKVPDSSIDPKAADTTVANEGRGTQQQDCAQEAMTGRLHQDAEEGFLLDPEHGNRAEIAELPSKATRVSEKRRGLACVRAKAASGSAVAVLVAVGALFASKRAEFGKQVAAALTFGIVIQRLRNGKLYSRFIFSAMASYLLCPLHSYLSVRVPKRLTLGAACKRKVEDEGQEKSPEAGAASRIDQEQNASFVSPIYPDSSSDPSSITHPAAEITSPSTLPGSPTTPEGSDSPSSTNLRRKLSLKLKSSFGRSCQLNKVAPGDTPLNSPRSPTIASGIRQLAPGSPTLSPTSAIDNSDSDTASSAPSQGQDAVARPKIGKSFSFSKRLRKRSESLKLEVTRQRGVVSESTGSWSPMRSGLNRMCSAPANEAQAFTTQACESGLQNIKTSFLQTVEDKREVKIYMSVTFSSELREIWPLCGFLVALLFLFLGRVAAILATSLFFLVLSQLQKLRSSRGQRQDKDVTRRALEASRKLNIASSTGSPVSPRRVDINSMEYWKRIIMEGLLERNRRSSGG